MMKNKNGKEVKIHQNVINYDLKPEWIAAELIPREDWYSQYECPFTDIPPQSGIYLFAFPNGFYLGQAKNLEDRFRSHFFQMYKPNCKDWHNSFGLDSWKAAKRFIKNECNYYYMLVDKDQLDLYEHSFLAQIARNNKTELYYNSIFYKGVDE